MFLSILRPQSIAQSCTPPNCWVGSFYQYQIVAQTGQTNSLGTFSSFGLGPSINEYGTVAFVGQVESSSQQILGNNPFIWNPSSGTPTAVAPNFLDDQRTFFGTLQINDENQIVTQDEYAGDPPFYYGRVWDGNQQNSFTLVAQSSESGFEAILGNPAIDVSNDVALSALDQSFNGFLLEANAPYSKLNQVEMKTPLAPLIADTGYTVVRAGNANTSPIVLYSPNLKTPTTIADTTQFSALGESPGISRDGLIVVFAGDLTSAGTAGSKAWDKYAGPGIFLAVIQNGQIQYRTRVAGFHYKNQDGMKNVQTSSVSKVPLEGAPWCDSPFVYNGKTITEICVADAELEDLPPFSSKTSVYFNTFTEAGFQNSTEWENRIAVAHAGEGIDGTTAEVSFVATPNKSDATGWNLFLENSGLWTVRVDLFVQNGKLYAHAYRPIPVIQIGSSIGNSGATVLEIGVYDDLANTGPVPTPGDHQLAYWVSTSNEPAGEMILFSSYIQQFGASGFNNAGCSPTSCQAGTLGALALISGNNYVLSNDHVLGGPISSTQNTATSTNEVWEPSNLDFLCETPPSVGNFFAAPTLSKGVDAALATLTSGQINTTGQIYNIGIPSGTGSPSVGEHVAKQGRSSALTCGTVQTTKMKVVSIMYDVCGNKNKTFTVPFTDQIWITSSDSGYPFLIPGDSGSLLVDAGTAKAIGLLFASSAKTGIAYANPIKAVMHELSVVTGEFVTLAVSSAHVVAGCHFSKPQVLLARAEEERADVVKQRYEAAILQDPAVIGVGVGAEGSDPSKPSIVVLVERNRYHQPIPTILDGIPVRMIPTDRPEALTQVSCNEDKGRTRQRQRTKISRSGSGSFAKSAPPEESLQ
ncbi:MAG TPA: hypothetical protein VN950_03625 [Terriglobales bacterium]|nr:hypothetical protein [Terriglobales bacterium]